MSKKFQMLFRGNVDTATMKVNKLDDVEYLVGPVVMAREIVMNGLFYPAKELAASVPHWNGCPVVVNHPKDDKGEYISANEPKVLESSGLGMVFNTKFDKKTGKLRAECWIKINKLELDQFKDVKDIIANGGMLEVSTGLWAEHVDIAGQFGNRDYNAIAVNHKPDHLALLPNDTGACSVADGAGFPRVNCGLDANELTQHEKFSTVGKAIRKAYSLNGNYAYLEDLLDSAVIFGRWEQKDDQYVLFRVSYKIDANEQTVTFGDSITKVVRRTNYVDVVDTNVLQTKATEGTQTPQTNGEAKMNKKDQIAKLLADGKIDANEAKTLEGMSDEQFAVYAKAHTTPTPPAAGGTEGGEGEGEDEEDKEEVEGNKKIAVQPPTPEVPEVNKDKTFQDWAKAEYMKQQGECITKILGNKANQYTKAELEGKPLSELQKISSLAANVADMGAAAAPATPKAPEGNAKKITPYIPKD